MRMVSRTLYKTLIQWERNRGKRGASRGTWGFERSQVFVLNCITFQNRDLGYSNRHLENVFTWSATEDKGFALVGILK